MSTPRVTLVDYGIGNLYSVQRALEQCGAKVNLARTAHEIASASSLVLPGVGAFADGMHGLYERDLVAPIVSHAVAGKPLLGICLGMQMLATSSNEFGYHQGLNLIPGHVQAIESIAVDGSHLKSPHIGWASIHPPVVGGWDGSILRDTPDATSVYLVHSFAVHPDEEADILAECDYGGHRIVAAICRGNVVGCQFHPEKSGPAGLRMLANFVLRPFDGR
jgi:glutamine amidotransferase